MGIEVSLWSLDFSLGFEDSAVPCSISTYAYSQPQGSLEHARRYGEAVTTLTPV